MLVKVWHENFLQIIVSYRNGGFFCLCAGSNRDLRF